MKRTILLFLCLVILASLAGCASNTTAPMPSAMPLNTDMMPTVQPIESMMPGTSAQPEVPSAAVNMTPAEAQQAAKRISDEVVKLSEIDKATTVVMGNSALVGVNFTAQYKGEMTTRIKDMVNDRAKKAVPVIQSVAVTADPDLLKRIQAMATDVTGGQETDISAQFSEIFTRIMPR